MRIVLDTGILVRASSRGLAGELLRLIQEQQHTLVTSPFILNELRRVMAYPRLRTALGFSDEMIEQYVQAIRDASELLDPVVTESVVRDKFDNPVLYTAVVGRAQVLCTRDKHFLTREVMEFCRMRNVQIVDEITLIRYLRRSHA
jgi:putative PIN family toxin of toxin-antitoxin system